MRNPICLITGATDGVGKVTALELAKKGFTIIVAARNPSKAEALTNEINTATGSTNAVHPGIVRTRMMLHAPGGLRLVTYLSLPFSVSPTEGARTSVYLASSPEVRGISGQYFAKAKRVVVKNRFDTAENRALLWELSEKVLEAPPESVSKACGPSRGHYRLPRARVR